MKLWKVPERRSVLLNYEKKKSAHTRTQIKKHPSNVSIHFVPHYNALTVYLCIRVFMYERISVRRRIISRNYLTVSMFCVVFVMFFFYLFYFSIGMITADTYCIQILRFRYEWMFFFQRIWMWYQWSKNQIICTYPPQSHTHNTTRERKKMENVR